MAVREKRSGFSRRLAVCVSPPVFSSGGQMVFLLLILIHEEEEGSFFRVLQVAVWRLVSPPGVFLK